MGLLDIFKRKGPKGPVIIAIHGFGKRRTDEYRSLVDYFGDRYDIRLPNLFDQRFPKDDIWYNWVSRAEEEIIKAKNEKREIILIGYSMGGVIATYLASKFEIKRLILLAPAFEYLKVTTATGYAFGPRYPEDDKYVPLPAEYIATFMDVVNNCRDGIDGVTCPTLFIHCFGDALIPYTVSLKYHRRLKIKEKHCVIIAEGSHRLMDDPVVSPVIMELIDSFIEGKLDVKAQHHDGKD